MIASKRGRAIAAVVLAVAVSFVVGRAPTWALLGSFVWWRWRRSR